MTNQAFTPKEEKRYRKLVTLLTNLYRPLARVQTTGIQNLPLTGPLIITPNHISLLDPIVTGTVLAKQRPVRALVKKSLTTAPIVKNIMKTMKHIPVDRGSDKAAEALETAEAALRENVAVAIYPEGTIPKENYGELGALKTGAQRLSLNMSVPILPVGQWGIQEVLPPKGKKLKSLLKALFTRPKHAIVLGETIHPTPEDTVETLTSKLREQLVVLTAEAKKIVSK